ncbi:putative transcription fungi [Rosellinia necatrix]|uniref:Putative transcription fungi n=1 Tax=Rosellinia necatrix TaxID=77044 RepID=A0A1W2TJ56_ROSNE|nr:putative transcription fungi [Rosellinia necatrix]
MFPPFNAQQVLEHAPVSHGLEVQLTPIICNDLDQLFFDRVHAFAPMVPKTRYLSLFKRPEKSRQKKCLQYAMWTLAASVSSQFHLIRMDLYAEARQLLNALDVENQGHPCPEQVQAWILLSIYELTSNMCNYQRGMVSAGRAFRLIQLMRLNEMDGPNYAAVRACWSGQGKGQCDWIDYESVRRTFWVAYTIDRFTSAIDGLPLSFSESQIFTRLPAPDSNFNSGRTTTTCFLPELMDGSDPERVNRGRDSSPFIQSIVVATICGRILEHKQLPRERRQYSKQSTSENEFFREHQALKELLTGHIKILSMSFTSMLEHPDPMLIFEALATQMAVLMLGETIETRRTGTDTQSMQVAESLIMEHQQWSLEAVHKMSMLAATIGQINCFQAHPFTPIPFLVSSRFCLRHLGLNDAYRNLVLGITTALEGLSSVNGLAQSCLRQINFEHS